MRVFSFAQESTRYCNYSKEKFGNELTCIEPSWYDTATDDQKQLFNDFLSVSEEAYMALLDKWENRIPDRRYKTKLRGNPLTPQQARQVLPNALKTEICMTGFQKDWVHFFDLRLRGLTGAPHPDMKRLAALLYAEFAKQGINL
jgi:thymidylate synthase (FAD)